MPDKSIPNVLAFPLDEALDVLATAGVSVRKTLRTSPPGAGKDEGRPRVVQQLPANGTSVDLVVALERQLGESVEAQRAPASQRDK